MDAYREFFGCRHPIVCAAMNQVSDAGLAIAVHRAGAMPSLSLPTYIRNGAFDLAAYKAELRAYKEATGSNNLLLSVGSAMLLADPVMRPFLDMGFRHIELFHWARDEPHWDAVQARSRRLAGDLGVRFLYKISTGHVEPGLDYPTLVLKGPDGAGRSADDSPPLSSTFDFCRAQFPKANVVVSGGIYNAAQVSDYLRRGALAIAIGSLFAASKESSIADSVKAKIVASGAAELQRQGERGLKGLFASVVEGDNTNLTRTLATGIRSADQGGVFIGNAIDHITEVLSVQEIVDRLVGASDGPTACI